MFNYLLPPSSSGKYYSIDSLVGEGDFGKVYRAHELASPHEMVAIKLPKTELNYKGLIQAHTRTMREVGLLQKASSEKVVRCLDYASAASFPYIVMDFVPHTLASVPTTPELIEDCIEQLPELLQVLHDSKIAHCDLRGNNVGYVDRTLKLLDFGLAIPFECSVLYLGRQAQDYLPPEFRRFNMVTKTTDTYSTGRVLERLLTGEYSRSPTVAVAKMKARYGKEPPRSFQRLFCQMLRPDHFLRPHPSQLRILAQDALRDLKRSNPFSFEATIPLSEAGIDFGISSSS